MSTTPAAMAPQKFLPEVNHAAAFAAAEIEEISG